MREGGGGWKGKEVHGGVVDNETCKQECGERKRRKEKVSSFHLGVPQSAESVASLVVGMLALESAARHSRSPGTPSLP